MANIDDKLTYLSETKNIFKNSLNSLGAEITSSTTFRNYLNWLDSFYDDASDKTDLSVNGVVGRTSQNTAILPSEYTQVDYIESSATQYIDTGVIPTFNTEVELEFLNKNTNSSGFIYGSRIANNNNCHTFILFSNSKDYYPQFGNNSSAVHLSNTYPELALSNTKYKIKNGKNGFYVNNIQIKNYSGQTTLNTPYPMYIFGLNQAGSLESRTARARIYYFKIYEESILIRDFIPCYRNNDNEVGLYDIVNDVFYTNQGTGTFTYGSVVDIPNPDYPQPINNLSGNVNYKIEGKNIFNVTDLTTITISNNGKATHTTTSDKIIVTTRSGSYYSGVYIRNISRFVDNYDSNKEYKVSFDIKANQSLSFKYGQDGRTIIETNIDTNLTRLSVSTQLHTSGFVFYSTQNRAGDTIEISNIMISESEDTTYEKYTGIRTFNIPLKSRNIVPTNISNWESGQYNPSGYKESRVSRIRLKELLPIEPNTTYYFDTFDTTEFSLMHTFIIRECNKNGSVINDISIVNNKSTYTTNINAYYLMVTIGTYNATSGETFKNYQTYFNGGKIKPFICLDSEIDKSYELYYDIELGKIATYEDKIYSSNGRFYLNKETIKYNLFELQYTYNSSSTTPVNRTVIRVTNMGFKSTYLSNIVKSSLQGDSSIPNRVVTNSGSAGTWWVTLADNLTGINPSDDNTTKVSKMIAYLQSKNAVLITYLSTPTTTEITSSNYPSLYNALKQIQDYLTAYKINKEFILGYSSPEIEY